MLEKTGRKTKLQNGWMKWPYYVTCLLSCDLGKTIFVRSLILNITHKSINQSTHTSHQSHSRTYTTICYLFSGHSTRWVLKHPLYFAKIIFAFSSNISRVYFYLSRKFDFGSFFISSVQDLHWCMATNQSMLGI